AIQIEGNATIPAEKIKQKLLSRVGQPVDQQKLNADLKTLMGMKWFSDVQVYYKEPPPKSGMLILTFSVSESAARSVGATRPACTADCRETPACCQSKATETASTASVMGSAACISQELVRCEEDGVVLARFDSTCPASSACTS